MGTSSDITDAVPPSRALPFTEEELGGIRDLLARKVTKGQIARRYANSNYDELSFRLMASGYEFLTVISPIALVPIRGFGGQADGSE